MNEKHIPVPSREQVVHQQLQSLLNVAGLMSQIAGQNAQSEVGGSIDGGAQMAAEQTLVKACNRLDAILDASTAWDMTGYDGLVNHLNTIYTAHHDLIRQQSVSLAMVDKPSRRYSPALVKLSPGKWIAVLGSLENLDQSIIGVGSCPEAALIEFDLAFKGEVSKEILEWAQAFSDATEAGTTLPNHPSNKPKNESTEILDPSGNDESPKSQGGGKNIRRSRKNLGPDGDIGPSPS